MTLTKPVLYAIAILSCFLSVYLLFSQSLKVEASSVQGNDYTATTTFALSATAERLLKTGPGSLGSVVITGKNTGLMTFYNATTSNVNNRTGQKATTTILIADFPTNAPEGTYTFDSIVTDGLLLVASGNTATSTITYR